MGMQIAVQSSCCNKMVLKLPLNLCFVSLIWNASFASFWHCQVVAKSWVGPDAGVPNVSVSSLLRYPAQLISHFHECESQQVQSLPCQRAARSFVICA